MILATLVYDFVVAVAWLILRVFFREVRTRGKHLVPKYGPVIFVCAPHANQFIDPLMLMTAAPRRVGFLTAKKSMDRAFIGSVAKLLHSIPVSRPQDYTTKPKGKIYLPDSLSNPLLLKGVNTTFLKDLAPRTIITLPSGLGSSEVGSVISDTEVLLKVPFPATAIVSLTQPIMIDSVSSESRDLTKDSSNADVSDFGIAGFTATPHLDQSELFDQVISRLHEGRSVGIFPEGGSHDRSDLLPLKAGFCIMALSAMAKHYNDPIHGPLDVKIVPVSLNYFHPDKFRSRAVVEFGDPVKIDRELVNLYMMGGENKRKAIEVLLDAVFHRLKGLLVTAPDYDQLMFIQAARRLYRPLHIKFDFETTLELTRKFSAGYEKYKDHPMIIDLRKRVLEYNQMLHDYGIEDHQVKTISVGGYREAFLLVFRSFLLLLMFFVAFPGGILNSPIIYLCQKIAHQKAKEAKAGSTVKIAGKDVIGTWKVLSGLVLVPTFYAFYTSLYFISLPHTSSLLTRILKSLLILTIILPSIAILTIRTSEVGYAYFKSLRPLFLAIMTPAVATAPIRKARLDLQREINVAIEKLGPEFYGDEFSDQRIVSRQEAINGEGDGEAVLRGKRLDGFRWEVVGEKETDDGVFLFEEPDEDNEWEEDGGSGGRLKVGSAGIMQRRSRSRGRVGVVTNMALRRRQRSRNHSFEIEEADVDVAEGK
ncbi:hypothetical protein HK096_005267 [Nowakowskiella sp. JEL0078]|nr:hypothetical protein HK096_005267 [Nowakowskiella sp. JEL0078]